MIKFTSAIQILPCLEFELPNFCITNLKAEYIFLMGQEEVLRLIAPKFERNSLVTLQHALF